MHNVFRFRDLITRDISTPTPQTQRTSHARDLRNPDPRLALHLIRFSYEVAGVAAAALGPTWNRKLCYPGGMCRGLR